MNDWLFEKVSGVEDIIGQAARRLQDVGLQGLETMRSQKAEAEKLVNERPQFGIDPDFLDLPIDQKHYYNALKIRLDMMRNEYIRALAKLRQEAEIKLQVR